MLLKTKYNNIKPDLFQTHNTHLFSVCKHRLALLQFFPREESKAQKLPRGRLFLVHSQELIFCFNFTGQAIKEKGS